MNALIIAVLGIPTFICSILLISFFDETKKALQSGYRRLAKEKKVSDPKEFGHEHTMSDDQGRPYYERYFRKRGRDFNDWDLSGGTLGI